MVGYIYTLQRDIVVCKDYRLPGSSCWKPIQIQKTATELAHSEMQGDIIT